MSTTNPRRITIEPITRVGVPVHGLNLPVLWTPGGMLRVLALARLLRRERTAILHSFGYGADVAAALAGRLARVPWIVTTRRTTGVEKGAHTFVYRRTNRFVHRILAVSEAARRWTIEHEGVPAIFAETTVSDELAQTLAAEVGGDIAVVDLYTGSLGEPGSDAETYVTMVRTNAQRIVDALAG